MLTPLLLNGGAFYLPPELTLLVFLITVSAAAVLMVSRILTGELT
jgi:hypothetical protein